MSIKHTNLIIFGINPKENFVTRKATFSVRKNPQEKVAFECRILESLGIVVRRRTYDKVYHVLFSNQELQSVRNIYGYIKVFCIEKFKKELNRKE